jgi:[ribosomal protein S5]-alanine N-acetyltransferase
MLPIPTAYGEIRPWRHTDADALVKYGNNRNVWLNLRDGFPHPYTAGAAQAFLERVSHLTPATMFAIATQAEAIGGIGFSINQDVHRLTAELGYWLGEPYWGRGIMSETVARLTDYAFEQFGLVRVYAEPYAHNAPSCRILEKAGYTLEGRLRNSVIKEGQILDQFMYAKIKQGDTGGLGKGHGQDAASLGRRKPGEFPGDDRDPARAAAPQPDHPPAGSTAQRHADRAWAIC